MIIEVFNTNNQNIDKIVVDGQDHIDICPYKGIIRRVFNTMVNDIKTYYIVIQAK